MSSTNVFSPHAPGWYILEYLADHKLTLHQAAAQIEMDKNHLQDLINFPHKTLLTRHDAEKLATLTMSVDEWLVLERQYRLWVQKTTANGPEVRGLSEEAPRADR